METIIHPLSFMLMHSLWQAFVVFACVRIILLFIPLQRSHYRYLAATVGLFVFLSAAVITFLYLLPDTVTETVRPLSTMFTPHTTVTSDEFVTAWHSVKGFISTNSLAIITIWVTGTFVFLTRLAGSIWYLHRLVSASTPVTRYVDLLERLKNNLGLRGAIAVLESVSVHSPLVTGILKPVIVLPAGLATGMSTDQIEAILLHELLHIKRRDYLVNVLQTLVESLFFFNPFVWLLSAHIREQREHCCDDGVVTAGIDRKSYVHALAALQEIRLAKNGIALSLAENKNALLNRIKRLMEKSVHHNTAREKMIPVLLLIIGFVCASWFTITPDHAPDAPATGKLDMFVPSDTIKPKKPLRGTEKSGQDNAPDTRDEVEPEYLFRDEGGFFPGIDIPDMDFTIPDIDLAIPDLPDVDFDFPDFPDDPAFGQDWEKFQEEFNTEFSERFDDLFNRNHEAIHKMIEKLQEKNSELFAPQHIDQHRLLAMQEKVLALQEEVLKKQERIQEIEGTVRSWQHENLDRMEGVQQRMMEIQKKMLAFQDELVKELITDGYIDSAHDAKEIRWDNGVLKINGKEIRPEHRDKYNAIKDDYTISRD